MAKEYFKTQTEYIQFDSDTRTVITVSDNPEIGAFYYSSFQHRGDLEFEGALFQAKIAAKLTQRVEELAQTDTTIITATDEYGRTQEFNPYQMARRNDYISTAAEFENAIQNVKEKINNA